MALADAAAGRGWAVTLLLGPTHAVPADSRVEVVRFQTAAELETLLRERFPLSDALIQAAAVADFRPAAPAAEGTKLRRTDAGLTLTLEPTPDLLAMCGKLRRPGQVLVGFALEPRERLITSAQDKLARKGADMIVANPLETMDSPNIWATLVQRTGPVVELAEQSKEAFATELLDRVQRIVRTPSI